MPDLYQYADYELENILDDLLVAMKRTTFTYETQAFILGEVIRIRRELLKRRPKDAA